MYKMRENKLITEIRILSRRILWTLTVNIIFDFKKKDNSEIDVITFKSYLKLVFFCHCKKKKLKEFYDRWIYI